MVVKLPRAKRGLDPSPLSQVADAFIAEHWPHWRDALGLSQAPRVLARLEGGLSNISYLLADAERRWVLRINADDPGLDRNFEARVHKLAAQAKIAPQLEVSTEHYMICAFVEHPAWPCDKAGKASLKDADIQALAQLLSAIHHLQPSAIDQSKPALNIVQRTQGQLQALSTQDASPYTALIDTLQVQQEKLSAYFKRHALSPEQLRLCHNDCTLQNILRSETGLCLIDWEYACWADPCIDLARLSLSAELNDEQEQLLLKYYAGDESADLHARMRASKAVVHYLDLLWYLSRNLKPRAELEALWERLLRLIED